ncbi:hypothetical protein B7494_g7693 [Chlorociboria aeruginascens]|nr:hypothetical protein B7494_g7693 [Chlorociboria aeruginascens]
MAIQYAIMEHEMKRKRSRPSEWWTAGSPAQPLSESTSKPPSIQSKRQPIQEIPAAVNREVSIVRAGKKESTKPKRGRPSKSEAEAQPIVAPQSDDQLGAKKRGRPSRKNTGEEQAQSLSTATAQAGLEGDPQSTHQSVKPLRRGRSSNAEVEIQDAVSSEAQHPPGKRNRRKHATKDIVDKASATAAEPDVPHKKRRWPSLTNVESSATTKSSPNKEFAPERRGRPSNVGIEAQIGGSSKAGTREKKGGRRTSDGVEPEASAEQEALNPKERIRASSPEAASSEPSKDRTQKKKRKEVEAQTDERRKRRRLEKSSRIGRPPSAELPQSPPKYQQLAAITHKVSRQTIETKWEPLAPNCVERISQMLQDVQRPILVRINDERKKIQASTIVQAATHKVLSKISKGLPFPHGTRNHREDDFDFEKILAHNRALEATLTPLLHSNALLGMELKKERAFLEAEQETLAELEANSRSEALTRKKAARKLHATLRAEESSLNGEQLEDQIGLKVETSSTGSDFTLENEAGLQSITKDINGHVDSVMGNLKQVDGITEAITASKAAVQATLFGHLQREQYDDIILG